MFRHVTAALGAIAALAATGAIAVVTTSTPAAATAATVTYKSPAPAASSAFTLRPGDSLVAGDARSDRLIAQSLPGATGYVSSFPPFELVLQGDGNLVEYQTFSADQTPSGSSRQVAVWSTRTTTAKRLVFQSDRNVVLLDAAGRALWSTGTSGSSATYFSVYGNGQLAVQDAVGRVAALVGKALTPAPGVVVGQSASPSSQYVLLQQADGNVVEYQRIPGGLRALWSTRTAGAGAVRLDAQSDGNLVLYQVSTGRAVWNSHTAGTGATYYQLDVQDDANVVLYRTDGRTRQQAVWASHTRA